MQKSTPVSKSTPLLVLTVVTNGSYGCSRYWKLMAFKTWYSPWHSSSTKSLWSPGYFSFQPSSWVKTFSQDFKLTLSCVTFFRILTTEVVMGSPSVQFIACISSWHSGWLEWCGKVVLFVCIIAIFVVTRSCAALRAADLDWIVGPEYSLSGYIFGDSQLLRRRSLWWFKVEVAAHTKLRGAGQE